ncbi:MAG: peptide ABC transporter permease [Rickettsiales bacterium]|nr:peptide ABC transporter permease [Rickettsiales bacterium]|tara:strand:+ start:2003 stop:2851 length:849 start_codon:yes stop_codon:yes gene_type:complete
MDPRAWRRFRKNKGALVGAVLVTVVTGLAVLGPLVAPHDPNEQRREVLLRDDGTPVAPGEVDGYTLGADTIGRDELSRLLHGGMISMQVAFLATLIAVGLGLTVGVVSGYFGGLTDSIAMRTVDIVLSIPFLLIAVTILQVVEEPSLSALYVLLGFLSWTSLARVTRAKVMQVRELEYVQAARALGASVPRILLRHVLPNVIGPAIVIATTLVAQMILVESAMSYLGLGVPPPDASWGSMLREGEEMLALAPRLMLYPSALIVMAVFGFNLLGEGLRDALDP